MRHKIFIAFLSLLTATSTLDMAKAQSLPYKNKNLPIEERVEDLLNRMTVDEKKSHKYGTYTLRKFLTGKSSI